LGGARVGLIANPTAIDAELHHIVDLLHADKSVKLMRLFGPEHGLRGEAQDMIAVEDVRDPATGLPVASLYGNTAASLTPKREHLAELDVLVFDIQDVGSRYYTFAATLALAMRAAREVGIKVMVLDRPNPINGSTVEGGGLKKGLESFVGLYPIPQRHAMTVGELARLYNSAFEIGCDLEVVACEGWRRSQYFVETGLPWVLPSPNMPTVNTAIVYPGMCLLEGTNVSEGRGTTRPFEILGAPFVEGRKLAAALTHEKLPGVIFRPMFFTPAFHKFVGVSCQGVQIHVTDRRAFLPYRTGLAILVALRDLCARDFSWRQKVYEFRNDVPAIDLLTGDPAVRESIDAGDPLDLVYEIATRGLEVYNKGRADALIYS